VQQPEPSSLVEEPARDVAQIDSASHPQVARAGENQELNGRNQAHMENNQLMQSIL